MAIMNGPREREWQRNLLTMPKMKWFEEARIQVEDERQKRLSHWNKQMIREYLNAKAR